jgi:hypothetical protein
METEQVQYGVRIMRPLLMVKKSDIYDISRRLAIPYLKNSTPSWSNRGKFREHFHTATVTQFGDNIDNKIIKFAETVQSQNKLLDIMIYEPIYNSFKDNCVNITTGVKAALDASNWLKVFEHICHMNLHIVKPSIKCMAHFCTRLYSSWNNELNLDITTNLKIKIRRSQDKYIMEFITC